MNSEQIVTKLQIEVKGYLKEIYQSIESSFSRIDAFLDQLPLAPKPLVPHTMVNDTPRTIANSVIKEDEQTQEKQAQLEQQSIIQDDHHSSNLKPFNYHLLQNYSIKQNKQCRAIALIKIIPLYQLLVKMYQQLLRQTQILSEHKDHVTTLNFMKKSTQFISTSHDKQIIIWSMSTTNQWIASQKLSGHSDWIMCLVLNNNEDLIISGSRDKTIKFWVKQNEWICSQTITIHKNNVLGLSLNEQQNQVISCGKDNFILIIEQSSEDQKWNVIQKISFEQYGYRLCFINDNIFTFQPYCEEFMHVYEMSSTNKQYVKTKDIPVKSGNGCECYFPQQYIKSKCLVVNKNGQNINLIKQTQNADFIVYQSIDFGDRFLMGQMSEDGEYLLTWDDKSKEIQIRKYHKEFDEQ